MYNGSRRPLGVRHGLKVLHEPTSKNKLLPVISVECWSFQFALVRSAYFLMNMTECLQFQSVAFTGSFGGEQPAQQMNCIGGGTLINPAMPGATFRTPVDSRKSFALFLVPFHFRYVVGLPIVDTEGRSPAPGIFH